MTPLFGELICVLEDRCTEVGYILDTMNIQI